MKILVYLLFVFIFLICSFFVYGSLYYSKLDQTAVFLEDGRVVNVEEADQSGWKFRVPFREYVLVPVIFFQTKMDDVLAMTADGIECQIQGLKFVYHFTYPGRAVLSGTHTIKDRELTEAPMLETLYRGLIQEQLSKIEASKIDGLPAEFWRPDVFVNGMGGYGVTIEDVATPTVVRCPAEPRPVIRARELPPGYKRPLMPDRKMKNTPDR